MVHSFSVFSQWLVAPKFNGMVKECDRRKPLAHDSQEAKSKGRSRGERITLSSHTLNESPLLTKPYHITAHRAMYSSVE